MYRNGHRVRSTRARVSRGLLFSVTVVAVTVGLGTASASGAPESAAASAPDLTIVSQRRQLTVAEIRGFDVTGSARGQAAMKQARGRSQADVDSRVRRVYVFGDQQLIVGAATPLKVAVGQNAEGKQVYEVVPSAVPAPVAAQAGYVVPPSGQWNYNNDDWFEQNVGTWHRDIWWTMTKANNYKNCPTCTAYDYWRLHGKLRASALTGSAPNEGFKRAWLEFRRQTGWTGSPTEFEADKPEESYGGIPNQTVTVGFGSSWGINLGVPPVTASGSVNTSYGGSMTKSSENWHPVIRTGVGNGGVQWCRYEAAEFTGTKVVSTRVGARISSTGSNGGWDILVGQQDSYSSCPSQV